MFSTDKLAWLNGHYIRDSGPEELADALLEYWGRYPQDGIAELPARDYLLRIVPLIRERLKTLADAAPLVAFFFADEIEYDSGELVQKRMDTESTKAALLAAETALRGLDEFDAEAIEGVLRPLASELGVKVGQLLGSLRVATTGLRVSPPLFETFEILGRERCLAAVRTAAGRL